MSGVRVPAAGLTIAALLLAGCGGAGGSHTPSSTRSSRTVTATGSGTGTTSTSTSTSTNAGSSAAGHGHTPRRGAGTSSVTGPRVGARQGVHIDGAYLTVTILRVLDLAHTGSALLPGTRQVGVELRIANQSGSTYDSTSSGDVSLVVSHGESEPLDIRSGVCETPLVDFESFVSAGTVRSGCVAFTVPRSARVVGVRFSPHSRAPGTLSWRVG